MRLSVEDLTEFGRARMEDDYNAVARRDGGRTSRIDFSLGWMSMAHRHKLWSYFTPEARARLEQIAAA
jgi:uncharacterized protein (DUF2132 family)